MHSEVDLRSELLAFHARHYSANVMRLAVLGRQTLDALQDLVLSAFSPIVNKNLTSPFESEPGGYPCRGALGRSREPGPVSAQGLRNPCPNTASGSARASTSIDHTARCDTPLPPAHRPSTSFCPPCAMRAGLPSPQLLSRRASPRYRRLDLGVLSINLMHFGTVYSVLDLGGRPPACRHYGQG